MTQACLVCDGKTNVAFNAHIFGTIETSYLLCSNCGFIFQPRPITWLERAYSSAITELDLGLTLRNIQNRKLVGYYIKFFLEPMRKFVDYGGGYGMFARMMRDNGFDYYRQDIYCQNIFAKHFDVTDLINSENEKFECLTAFEVFEHLEHPDIEVAKMAELSDTILFSTLLIPKMNTEAIKNWWYICAETGQHISFYTEKALHIIAEQLGFKYYKLNNSHHVFSKSKISKIKLFLFKATVRYGSGLERFDRSHLPSLLQKDFEKVKKWVQTQ